MGDAQTACWAPVVYGRTAAADTWWQAVPDGVSPAGWLTRVVYAAVDRGRELDKHPRFLLAQEPGHRVVGVACRARDLSDEMHSDGLRELYCFVGWLTVLPADDEADMALLTGPGLDEFQKSYVQWAAPVYTGVMGGRWRMPLSFTRDPVTTHPQPAPWAGDAYDPADPLPRPDTGLWPAETWPPLWAAALSVLDPLTCVIGWQRAGTARQDSVVTHLGAANAPDRAAPVAPQPVPQPVPLVPVPSASPEDASAALETVSEEDTGAETAALVPVTGPGSRRDQLVTWLTAPVRHPCLPAWMKPRLPGWSRPRVSAWTALSQRARLIGRRRRLRGEKRRP